MWFRHHFGLLQFEVSCHFLFLTLTISIDFSLPRSVLTLICLLVHGCPIFIGLFVSGFYRKFCILYPQKKHFRRSGVTSTFFLQPSHLFNFWTPNVENIRTVRKILLKYISKSKNLDFIYFNFIRKANEKIMNCVNFSIYKSKSFWVIHVVIFFKHSVV